jgi:hypothetical protein
VPARSNNLVNKARSVSVSFCNILFCQCRNRRAPGQTFLRQRRDRPGKGIAVDVQLEHLVPITDRIGDRPSSLIGMERYRRYILPLSNTGGDCPCEAIVVQIDEIHTSTPIRDTRRDCPRQLVIVQSHTGYVRPSAHLGGQRSRQTIVLQG